jgi:hypothetical protein
VALTEASSNKVRFLTGLLLLAVFVVGNVSGAALYFWFAPQPIHRHHQGLPPPFGQLGLSKEKEREVMRVFDKHRPELEAILRETYPKARAVFDVIDKEISVFLTDEQKKKLQQFDKKPPFGGPMGFGPNPPPPPPSPGPGCPPDQPPGACAPPPPR